MILVAGATGQLGGVIARKLLEAGVPVRALARSRAKLEPLAALGAEVAAVDLLDMSKLPEALKGIDQVVSTVNNNMGKGEKGPGRIDLTAHQNLCAAMRNARTRRLMYVSFRGVVAGEPVDIFRIKWYIEDAIRRSGIPYVLLRPTAFMDIWIDHIIAGEIRSKGRTVVFGDGTAVANYITVDDVATYAVRVLEHDEIVNEGLDVGGPSNISMNDLATLVERRFGATGKRKHVPEIAMKLAPIVRPFNEVAARMMSLGLFAATRSRPFPDWKTNADRFGVTPRSVEEYVAAMPTTAPGSH